MKHALSCLVAASLLLPLIGCAHRRQAEPRQLGFVRISTERLERGSVSVSEMPDPRTIDPDAWKQTELAWHPIHADGEWFRPPADPPSADELRGGSWSFRYVWRAWDEKTAGNSFPRGVHGTFYLMNLPDGRFALIEPDEQGRLRVLDHGLPRCTYSGPGVTTWDIAGDRLETLLAPPLIDLGSSVQPARR